MILLLVNVIIVIYDELKYYAKNINGTFWGLASNKRVWLLLCIASFVVLLILSIYKSCKIEYIIDDIIFGLLAFLLYYMNDYYMNWGTNKRRKLYYYKEKRKLKSLRSYQLKYELAMYMDVSRILAVPIAAVKFIVHIGTLFIGAILITLGIENKDLVKNVFDCIRNNEPLFGRLLILALEMFISVILGWFIISLKAQMRKTILSDIYEYKFRRN